MDYAHMDDFKDLLSKKNELKCTYESEDANESDQYFFCSCTFKKLHPICRECIGNCHKTHTKILRVEKDFMKKNNKSCECGKNCHKHFIEDKGKKSCFISEILTKIQPNINF